MKWDGYTSTTNNEGPELTLDALHSLWDELNLPVLYRMSEYLPKVDADGKPVYFSIPSLELALGDVVLPTPKSSVIYIHPDNLPYLQQMALTEGFRLQRAE